MLPSILRYLSWLAIFVLLAGVLLLTTAGWAARKRINIAAAAAANESSNRQSDHTGQLLAPLMKAGAASPLETALPQLQEKARSAAFTLVLARTVSGSGQPTRLVQTTTRQQRVDGLYRLEQTFFGQDGRPAGTGIYYGITGYGVFRRDDVRHALVFTGPQVELQVQDIAGYLRQNPLFVREETVAGQRTIVWRDGAEGANRYREEYRAPGLGGLLIRSIVVLGARREMIEPTSLEMVEPSPALFVELSLLPTDYAPYLRQIEQMERTNQPEEAQVMRQLLSRARSVKP
jgi:hypothetical protein